MACVRMVCAVEDQGGPNDERASTSWLPFIVASTPFKLFSSIFFHACTPAFTAMQLQ